jgi:hypothetical protein
MNIDFNAAPLRVNFTRYAGDQVYYPVAETFNGNAWNLTAHSLRYVVSLDGTTVASGAITPSSAGSGYWEFSVATDAAWEGVYDYAIEQTIPVSDSNVASGGKLTILCGTITVLRDLTPPA